jgi:hypothetical protein
MTITMKALILSVLVLIAPASFAEGVASMTTVTAANGKSLAHHGLAVICKSQHGKTFVDLVFRPQKETPFVACSITIYDRAGEKILVQVDPEIHRAPKLKGAPDGSRVFFHVADELVDGVEIMYHLRANEIQSHVFTIKRGELQKVADLPQ